MACELCLDMGYRVPPFLRLFYFMQISNAAIDRYEPRAYPTPFIVLRRAENGTGDEWRHLATDKVEIHEIDAEHLEIIQEPYVQILADKLRSLLDNAQRAIVDQELSGLLSPSLVPASSIVPADVLSGVRPKGGIW